MRALVTGCAGFLGSHLTDRLLERGYEVVGVDNFITGSRRNLEGAARSAKFKLLEHNLFEPFYIEEKVDEVWHLASPASPVGYLQHPIHTLKVGALGTYHTLGLAKAHGAKYLLASMCEVYGDPAVNPQPESYWGNVNPIGPRGVYDEAKRYAEAITMAYHRVHGLETRIARIFNTYGPRMRLDDGRVVPNLVGQALRGEPLTIYGDGQQTRSFCYVSDLVEGLLRLMASKETLPTNIGNPRELSILEFAKMIQEHVGSSSALEFKTLPQDDPKQRRPDISKAKRLLGWEPKVELEHGLRDTIAHFRGRLAEAKTGA